MNDCGQVVVARGYLFEETEVFLYDNGVLTQMTNNRISDDAPDINNRGVMTWMAGFDGFYAGEIVIFRNRQRMVLAPGQFPSVNDLGHIVWSRTRPEGCRDVDSDIYFYDGNTVARVSDGFLSNQSARINHHDQIVWTRYNFCDNPWTTEIILYSDGRRVVLPASADDPRAPDINDRGQVAWGGSGGIKSGPLELWTDGRVRRIVDWGGVPALNNNGNIHFLRFHDNNRTWQGWLYTIAGEVLQLTDDPFWNADGDINDSGEITWHTLDRNTREWRVRLMRRIRTGDSQFDGAVDLIDNAQFAACMTGPEWVKRKNHGPHDTLCDCRFLDINHDGSVDLKDFAIFQRNFTGSE